MDFLAADFFIRNLVLLMQVIASMGETILLNLSDLLFSTPTCNFLQIVVSKLSNTSIFLRHNGQTPQISCGSLLATLRRFTLPYLRRCALFKKFLFASYLEETKRWSPIIDAAATLKVLDWTSPDGNQDMNDSLEYMKELEVLEGEFSIPSLQQILESEHNQQLVLLWCQHLIKESVTRKLLPIPKPVLAVPFKLMDLPPLYQTLLQR